MSCREKQNHPKLPTIKINRGRKEAKKILQRMGLRKECSHTMVACFGEDIKFCITSVFFQWEDKTAMNGNKNKLPVTVNLHVGGKSERRTRMNQTIIRVVILRNVIPGR